ncbi:hypothetical protein [Chitiniphilus shinanonensis]
MLLDAAHFIAIFMLITFLSIETVLCKRDWMPGGRRGWRGMTCCIS